MEDARPLWRGGGAVLALTLAAVGIGLVIAATPARTARAQSSPSTFTVTRTDDPEPATCDADCSLREAIGAANATTGDNVIDFAVGTVTLSRNGADEQAFTGDLDIINTSGLTIINGGGVVISGGTNYNGRIFDVASGANANISGVTVEGGKPERGAGEATGNAGGINVDDGATLTLSDSTVRNNRAQDNGGGIRSRGNLTVERSTFSGNTADSDQSTINAGTIDGLGGGLAVTLGTASVNNSTISGNQTLIHVNTPPGPTDPGGGGVGLVNATLSLTNVTIADNAAPNSFGGGIANISGNANNVLAHNTIVANNTQRDNGQCGGAGANSTGGSMEFPGASCNAFRVDADPRLGPLADNGGPTQTQALLAGSAAIDAGVTPFPATDQRGITRPQGRAALPQRRASDIGAFELQQTPKKRKKKPRRHHR